MKSGSFAIDYWSITILAGLFYCLVWYYGTVLYGIMWRKLFCLYFRLALSLLTPRVTFRQLGNLWVYGCGLLLLLSREKEREREKWDSFLLTPPTFPYYYLSVRVLYIFKCYFRRNLFFFIIVLYRTMIISMSSM